MNNSSNNLDSINLEDLLKIVESNHLEHFKFLPSKLGFDIKILNDVTIINSGLQTSMFNIAYGYSSDVSSSDDVSDLIVIDSIKKAFSNDSDSLPFAWWIPQSQCNASLKKFLLNNSFTIETTEHAMILDLQKIDSNDLTFKTDLKIKAVEDNITLNDFISVLEVYDSNVRSIYEKMNQYNSDDDKNNNANLFKDKERLFVGYAISDSDDSQLAPVIIGILFINNSENITSSGIFSLITKEEARGKGYGTDMMRFLIQFSQEINCKFVTLSASSDSGYRIYERLGFEKVGEFECFEYSGN